MHVCTYGPPYNRNNAAITCCFHKISQPGTLVVRNLPYWFSLDQRRSGHYTTMHRFSLIFGIELCESLRDVSRKIVFFYRDFSL